jgi:hypothetical protein
LLGSGSDSASEEAGRETTDVAINGIVEDDEESSDEEEETSPAEEDAVGNTDSDDDLPLVGKISLFESSPKELSKTENFFLKCFTRLHRCRAHSVLNKREFQYGFGGSGSFCLDPDPKL